MKAFSLRVNATVEYNLDIVFPTKTFFGLIVFLTKTILKIAYVSATEVGKIPVLYVAMTLLVLALTMLSMFEPELRIYS